MKQDYKTKRKELKKNLMAAGIDKLYAIIDTLYPASYSLNGVTADKCTHDGLSNGLTIAWKSGEISTDLEIIK